MENGLIQIQFPIFYTYRYWQQFSVLIDTLEELAAEKLNTHNGKYQPKDQTHQQHITNGGNGKHECIYHYSHTLPPRYSSKRPKRPKRSQRSQNF